ncbi:hypothetical protein [Adhaeribacter soli]|uniref:Uncharacterized protein n=1 Tax=Adhaeribacter soli TaxID=2607655 RepID=A0A5N1J0M6_9BACT|nr:hypothetical protein [Adhaeribacter soli]KAA9340255.1 hypothetical protein F0P94_07875 [Adhaeribacter soli]
MIIGDINNFAVEFSFAENYPKEMGFGKIWVRGKFIGTSEDLIYLNGYLLRTLYEFKKPILNNGIAELNKNQLFERLKKSEDWVHRVSSTTFIDDFVIFSYQRENRTYLLWKLEQDSFFNDLKSYSKEVQQESVETKVVEEVIKKVEAEFKNAGIIV